MTIKKILELGDHRLYVKSEAVSKMELEIIEIIIKDLHDTMMDFKNRYKMGRAIAAPQIGIMKRLIYLNMGQPEVLINPKLTFPDEETIEIWDDCMSFPNLLVKVKRFKRCIIQYEDMEGKEQIMQLEGDLSELIQHEYDHLDGILAIDRAIDNRSFALRSEVNRLPRKIGIVGGISHESTIRLYEYIHEIYYKMKKDYYYPEVLIYSLNFQRFTDFENSGNRSQYINEIMKGINSLEAGSADFIIFAANSPHSVFEEIENQAKVPMLSIVKEVARYCQREKLSTLLLLGIKHTMENDFYHKNFANEGMKIITPNEEEKEIIERIIFDELVLGIFNAASKKKVLDTISSYQVDGVILGCTELPLFIKQEDTSVKIIDTLKIHAEAAVRYSLTIN